MRAGVVVLVLLMGGVGARGAAPFVHGPAKAWTGVIEAHDRYVCGLTLSADGNTLLTTGDRKVALWDLRTGKLLRQRCWRPEDKVFLPAFVSGGKELVCVLKNAILLLDARSLKTRATLKPPEFSHSNNADCVAASPDGTKLAVGFGRTLVMWDLETNKVTWRLPFEGAAQRVDSVTFSPTGKVVAAALHDKDVLRLHDVKTGRELGRLAAPSKVYDRSMMGLLFSLDGQVLAGASRRHAALHLWDVSKGELSRSLSWKPALGASGAFSLAASPDGKTLVCAGADGQLRLFEAATGGLRLKVDAGRPYTVCDRAALCPHGRLIRLDYPKQGQIDVWDWRRGTGKAARPSDDDILRLWRDLGSREAAVGHRAVCALLTAPEQALHLIARLPRIEQPSEKQLATLIAGLDAEDPDERDKATDELTRAGPRAEKALRKALRSDSLEVRKRAASILRQLGPLHPERLRFLRAVEVLEAIATPAATKHLERLAGGFAGCEETDDAAAALARVRQRKKQDEG
jgi:WD40 repeat protein